MAFYLGNERVAGNFGASHNLVTDGDAVKTGRIIDGKEEYVKRYHVAINGTNGDITKALGFDLSKVTVTNIDGAFISNSDNIFAINSGVQSTIAYDYAVQCRASDNMLLVRTYNGNFASANINIYYIKNT